MAFTNANGQSISFDSSNLIKELMKDIAEFGGDQILEVVTEEKNGVTIYKDYNFLDEDESTSFPLSDNEKLQKMTASALLILYEKENSIL